jgi:hypothetical protein
MATGREPPDFDIEARVEVHLNLFNPVRNSITVAQPIALKRSNHQGIINSAISAAVVAVRPAQACTENLKLSLARY